MTRRGRLFIVSAPSGTGKTTLVDRLVEQVPGLVRSRSYTARPIRPGEVDRVDYNFVEASRFREMIDAGAFLEWAEVFGRLYGTGAADTDRHRAAGRDVVLVIDVQGARQVRSQVDAVSIFVLPPSLSELERRLHSRMDGASAAELARRLETARHEVEMSGDYEYAVVNDDIDGCVERLRQIVLAERSSAAAMADTVRAITETFRRPVPGPGGRLIMGLVALGVSGGIGAYKAVEVARGLQQRGHDVAAVMTANAQRFVGPLTFEAITKRRVATDQFAPGVNADIDHIALATEADLLLVAPATANVIGKFAGGVADDFLTSLYLATTAPVLLAPAMNTNMLAHAAVQANLRTLAERGVRFVDPGEGYLACGWVGKGRLAEPEQIVEAAGIVLRGRGEWTGRALLVTAGPTCEDIDPVRFLGNRSTGRMGYAVAAEATARGARVLLVSGPTELPPPHGVEHFAVRSAAEMHETVMRLTADGAVDAVVMAAAVADYTPAAGASLAKLKKRDDELVLALRRTPDVLADLGARRGGGRNPILIGFAAETQDTIGHAREKLSVKQADLIVANDVTAPGSGFGTETNAAHLVSADGVEPVSLRSKRDLARIILDRIDARLAARARAVPS